MLAHQDGLLDFGLLNVAVPTHLIDAFTSLRCDHLVILHLFHLFIHLLVVALLELEHFVGTLTGLLNLLPRLDLLLLEQGDSIG